MATSTAGYTLGLAATTYSISTNTGNLGGGSSTLEINGGFPTLQGIANLETLARNGTQSFSTDSYTATNTGSSTDTGININSGINTSWPGNSIIDEIRYVYASTANQTYDFNVTYADDGTEVFLGGNGTTGSGAVVAAQNSNSTLGSGISDDTAVTFTKAGLYHFEIFNAQTWDSTTYQFSYGANSATPSAPALTYYSATPEPATLAVLPLAALFHCFAVAAPRLSKISAGKPKVPEPGWRGLVGLSVYKFGILTYLITRDRKPRGLRFLSVFPLIPTRFIC